MDRNLLGLTLGPALAIAIYVFWRDKYNAEPKRLLIKAYLIGCVSVLPATLLHALLQTVFKVKISHSLTETFMYAFLVVAISEETSKFIALRWRLFPKPDFDEPYDGITYSVLIGMGFASVENIMYVYQSADPYSVATLRAFTAVPAHATFAVAMGYYAGLAKFSKNSRWLYLAKGLLLAIVLHGTYDFLLMQKRMPLIAFGAFISVIISIVLSLKAIKLHQNNSPFNPDLKL